MARRRESGLVRIPLRSLLEAPENSRVYAPVTSDDPAIIALAEDIRIHGIKEPLVVTLDHYILSGHRRAAAARLAGLREVPCRVENIRRAKEPDRFLKLLVAFNKQRVKTTTEQFREIAISINSDDAHAALVAERKKRARIIRVERLELRSMRKRAKISAIKQPLLDAIKRVLEDLSDYLPLSERQIHYNLLNDPPLTHKGDPDSVYRDPKSADLSDLVTRARITGEIDPYAINDETRPVIIWDCYDDPGNYLNREINGFLKSGARNLMRSQPNHIELLIEKNTILNVINDISEEFCIPTTSGRGFASFPPRRDMAERFRTSGKENLILIIASDFDPAGETIAETFARSMRDDFGIENIHPIKAALTYEQVTHMDLQSSLEPPKPTGKDGTGRNTHYKAWLEKYGPNQKAYELEAVPPAQLQLMIREVIESVIDRKLLNEELRREKEDAAHFAAVRQMLIQNLKDLDGARK